MDGVNKVASRAGSWNSPAHRGRVARSLILDGFLGWWAWLVIHIGFMTGFRNRFGALASWWFAFTRDLRRERTFTSRDIGVIRDVYGAESEQLISATETAGAPGSPGPAGASGPGKPPSAAQ